MEWSDREATARRLFNPASAAKDQTSATSDDGVLTLSCIMKTIKRLFIYFVKTVLVPSTVSKISLLSSQRTWNEKISMDVQYVIKEINYNLYDSQKCSNVLVAFVSVCSSLYFIL